MKPENVKLAQQLAHQFIARAVAYEKRVKDDPTYTLCGTAEGGALRRTSMDLTRALTQMRKP